MTEPIHVDQLLAGFADGDAISHHARLMRDVLRAQGFHSDIFVDPARVSPTLRGEFRPLAEYQSTSHDACRFHYSIASPATDAYEQSAARKVLIYHNITPAEYFRGYDDGLVRQLTEARAQLAAMAQRASAVWAVSRFNAGELEALGARNVKVVPLPLPKAMLDIPPDPLVTGKFGQILTTLLFVSRLAPNKRVEDLIQAFAWYHRGINPFSRLLIVGSDRGCPRYATMLRMLVADLDLANICFEGFASPAGLTAYYRVADVYLSTSAHEGFGLPLVEAMYYGVPVIARAVGGTPEAMGPAGVLYDDLAPPELAALIHRVTSDQTLRGEILHAQQQRVQQMVDRPLGEELQVLLRDLLA